MVRPSEFIALPEDRVLLLSEIVDNTKNNYAIGFENKTRLESLQEWVTKQREIFGN